MKRVNSMRSTSKLTFVVLLGFAAALMQVAPTVEAQKNHKNKYHNIEVARFDTKEGVQFPADYLITMTEELVTQLQETGKFKQVLREGEIPAEAGVPTIRLTGTVTEFKKGSHAKRFLLGPGFGKTKVKAHVKFIDAATGEVLFEDDVDGKVVLGGLIKSESIGATRGLAKEVAKVTKKQFF
jgi:curli biogenesis system outer membrane secretion channel CsgG